MDNIWIILIVILISFSFFVNIKTKFISYNLSKIIKAYKDSNKTGFLFSLATKVGVGTFISTTSAIVVAKEGAIFWLLLFSFLTMPLVYIESYYGVKHKKDNVSGPYYINKYGLNNKILAIISSVLLVITYSFLFQAVQVNTIKEQVLSNTNLTSGILLSLIMLFIIFIIFFKNKFLIKLINTLVPIMCIIFILVSIFILMVNYQNIFSVLKNMLKSAFNSSNILLGIVFSAKRSVFLNELMLGTTAVASAQGSDSKKESLLQVLSVYFLVFFVTLCVSITILLYMKNNVGTQTNYITLINNAYKYHLGANATNYVSIILVLFACTTMISGYYIGKSLLKDVFNSKVVLAIFNTLFIVFCLYGYFMSSGNIWQLTDTLLFFLILLNLYSIIKLVLKG